MLEGGNDELKRAHFKKVMTNQYKRLDDEKSEAGAEVLAATVRSTTEKYQLCRKVGHSALQCRGTQNSKGQHHSRFSGQCFTWGMQGNRAEECKGAKGGGMKVNNGKPKTSSTDCDTYGDERHKAFQVRSPKRQDQGHEK